jgi:hypothetical protein
VKAFPSGAKWAQACSLIYIWIESADGMGENHEENDIYKGAG